MGEKGNITSDELLTLSKAAGVGGSASASVTAVVEKVSDTFQDKVVDKSVDAAIDTGVARFTRSDQDGPVGDGPGSAGT